MMPVQSSSTSKQNYETPPEFIAAVETRFGSLHVDLACGPLDQLDITRADNRKAPLGIVYPNEDTFSVAWAQYYGDMNCWLNPEFKRLEPYFEKCAREAASFRDDGKILVLTPASVGANYFSDYVHKRALVLALQPRITFVGEKDPYPKDCVLSIYGPSITPGFDVWRCGKS